MKTGMRQKLKIEILAVITCVLVGVILGEKDFGRNLVSGIVSAIVSVLIIEIYFKAKENSAKKNS